MIWGLLRHDDGASRAQDERALSIASWVWPLPGTEDYCGAQRLVPSGPPTLRPGEVPVVSVSEDPARNTVSLWKLELLTGKGRAPGAVAFAPETQELWTDIADLLPTVLPVLWQTVPRGTRPIAYRVGACRISADHHEIHERVLDGDSFGLAFALSLTSAASGIPLRDDVIASATVRDGRTLAVGEVTAKVNGICTMAPRIRRLLVHPDNAKEARAAAAGRLRVYGVATVAAALSHAFRLPLQRVIVDAARDVESRRRLVASLVSLSFGPRVTVVDWTPVRKAAQLALKTWKPTLAERRDLRWVAAFAERHETNRGRATLPPRQWLADLPEEKRLRLLSQLMSQSTYSGSPAPQVIARLARKELPNRLNDASVEDLKLHGALARFEAVIGRPKKSLRLQERIAFELLQRQAYQEISYQLAEWYRLAGALNDRGSYERAGAMDHEIERQGGIGDDARPFVDISRAAALWFFGRYDEAERDLCRLSTTSHRSSAAHLRWSSDRWLIATLRSTGRLPEVRSVEARLRRAAAMSHLRRHKNAPIYWELACLDRALVDGDRQAMRTHFAAAHALEPGVMGHLARAARRSGQDVAAYVARFYPD
jgi:hypothetical protein